MRKNIMQFPVKIIIINWMDQLSYEKKKYGKQQNTINTSDFTNTMENLTTPLAKLQVQT